MISTRRSLQNILISLLLSAVTLAPCLMDGYWYGHRDLTHRVFHMITLTAIIFCFWRWRRSRHLLTYIGQQVARLKQLPDRWFIGIIALVFFLVTCTLSDVLFSHLPHIADSQAQYIQSKIFASGKLYEEAHPIRGIFATKFMGNGDKYYSFYPPGHALLLAIGQLIALPWIINPLLGALFVVAVYALGRELGTPATGRIAALLALVSPFLIFMASEYMNHSSALLSTTLMVLFYIRLLKRPNLNDALYLGLSVGFLGFIRPQVLLQLGLFFVPHALYMVIRNRAYLLLFAFAALVASPFGLFFLYYNYQTSGDPYLSGYHQMFSRTHAGVGSWILDLLGYAEYGVSKHFIRVGKQIGAYNQQLFAWPIASLGLAVLLFLFRLERKHTWILAALFLSICLGLTLASPGWMNLFGPKYMYETCGAVLVLTAMLIERLPLLLHRLRIRHITLPLYRGTVLVTIMVMSLLGIYNETYDRYVAYKSNYWEGYVGYYEMVMKAIKKPAIVGNDLYQFHHVSFTMPQDDDAPVLFTRRHSLKKIREQWPDRYIYYVYNGPGKQEMGPIWVAQIFSPARNKKEMESDSMIYDMVDQGRKKRQEQKRLAPEKDKTLF